jgi:ADP-ribose pyrophosphatase YjhB (NUDIX family)
MQKSHDSRAGSNETRLSRPAQWLLHRWFLLQRSMTLGVRAVVLDDADRVLLVRHTYTDGWHLPGGGVEVGETLEMALAKELREEAAVTLAGPTSLHGVFLNERLGRRDHVAVFVVRDFTAGVMVPTREIAEARFHALHDLPTDITRATERRLREILHDEPLSAYW